MSDRLPRLLSLPSVPRSVVVGKEEGFIPIGWARQLTDALRANHVEVAERVEELTNYGDAASIPDASGAGKFYWEDDTDILKFDDGAWEAVGGVGGFLPLSAGSSYPLTGDLFIDAAANPTIWLREGGSTSSYTLLQDATVNTAYLRKIAASGIVLFDIDAIPSDGTSDAAVRLFRGTNTVGAVTLNTYLGDGTTTVQHALGSTGAILCANNGELVVRGDGIVNIEAASGPSYLKLKAESTATYYTDILQYQSSLSIRQYNTNTDGAAYIKINPMPDGAGEAGVYFFLDTDTTGAAFIDIKIGQNSATSQHKIEADTGHVNLCKQAGTLTVGDATDKVTVDRDGVYLFGTATMWDDLRFPAVSIRAGAATPTWATFKNGTNAWHFSKVSDNEVEFAVQLPHSWKEGSDIEPHVHWCPIDTDTGDVTWKLEYTWANINATFGATSTASVTDAADGTAYKHQISDLTSISGAGKTMSSMLICRLYRDVSDADDYDNSAALLEVDFHIEINSLGSKEEYVKGP